MGIKLCTNRHQRRLRLLISSSLEQRQTVIKIQFFFNLHPIAVSPRFDVIKQFNYPPLPTPSPYRLPGRIVYQRVGEVRCKRGDPETMRHRPDINFSTRTYCAQVTNTGKLFSLFSFIKAFFIPLMRKPLLPVTLYYTALKCIL